MAMSESKVKLELGEEDKIKFQEFKSFLIRKESNDNKEKLVNHKTPPQPALKPFFQRNQELKGKILINISNAPTLQLLKTQQHSALDQFKTLNKIIHNMKANKD